MVTFGAMEVVDMLAFTLLEMMLGARVGVMIGSLMFVGPVLGTDGGSDGPIGGVVMLAGGLTSCDGGMGVGEVGGMPSKVVSGRGSRMSLALAELEMTAEGPAWRLCATTRLSRLTMARARMVSSEDQSGVGGGSCQCYLCPLYILPVFHTDVARITILDPHRPGTRAAYTLPIPSIGVPLPVPAAV